MKQRDLRIDSIKGIAISMVIVGHIMQQCFENHAETILFNIIWAIQIPIFMIVSGYLSKYEDVDFFKTLRKNARAYLIPFISCFIVGVLFFHRSSGNLFEGAQHLIYHLEDSLWYVFVLFVLSVVHVISCEFSNKLTKANANSIKYSAIYTFAFICLLLPWVCFAVIFGTTFLGAKYVLYYSIFYLVGQLWRRFGNRIYAFVSIKYPFLIQAVLALSILMFTYIVTNFGLKLIDDNILGITIRLAAGLCGCVVLIVFVMNDLREDQKLRKYFSYLGVHSLEIYYVHYLLYWFITSTSANVFSVEGIAVICVNYVALLLISVVAFKVVQLSPMCNLIIFGKKEIR